MPCPTHDNLVSYVAGDLEGDETSHVAEHLASGCDRCTAELAAIAELRRVASSDALAEPPPWVLSRAAGIPSQPPVSRLAQLAGSIASLVFDTLRDPLPNGARSVAAHSRQMLYRTLGYDIDVRVAPASGGNVRISGQILPGNDRPMSDVAGIDAVLVTIEGSSTPGVTNELGEFEFDHMTAGTYSLMLEAPEDRLIIENLSAHAS